MIPLKTYQFGKRINSYWTRVGGKQEYKKMSSTTTGEKRFHLKGRVEGRADKEAKLSKRKLSL